jgi:hypothetical protein
MNTLTVRPVTGLIPLSRCPVRWCAYYGDDVPTDHTHHSDQPTITLALEGGAILPEQFVYGDGPDDFEPADYALANVIATLVQPMGEELHVTIGVYNVDGTEVPRFTLAEVEQLRDQLDELLAHADRMPGGAR